MFPRLEGELIKIVQGENGWIVYFWDPEPPKPAVPGQAPCAQQPVKFWRTYVFKTLPEVILFVGHLLGAQA